MRTPCAGSGPFVLTRVEPLVLGMPLLLARLEFCTIGTAAIMGVIDLTDPANRADADETKPRTPRSRCWSRSGRDMDTEQWSVGGRRFGALLVFPPMAGEI